MNRIEIIKPEILCWAIERAGHNIDEFLNNNPKVYKWITQEKYPTRRQLEDFASSVYIPFGYLFFDEPLHEESPIPFFRTFNEPTKKVSLNVYDTLTIIQARQDWLREYLIENDFPKLDFVGKYRNDHNINKIVKDIRLTLNLPEGWAQDFSTYEDSLNFLVSRIENAGIIISFNGVVGNNNKRKIPVDECRGFVFIDDYAPFLFVNNSDWKSAQIFTILHEIAHIWIGESAGFDFDKLLPSTNEIELICDKIAAEFLVPTMMFEKAFNQTHDFKVLSKMFKVSQIVIARRALDTNSITKERFYSFYRDYHNNEFDIQQKKSSGGNFYATTKKKLGMAFSIHVNNAVKSGQLMFRDAYNLTNLKGGTFNNYFSNQL